MALPLSLYVLLGLHPLNLSCTFISYTIFVSFSSGMPKPSQLSFYYLFIYGLNLQLLPVYLISDSTSSCFTLFHRNLISITVIPILCFPHNIYESHHYWYYHSLDCCISHYARNAVFIILYMLPVFPILSFK